MPRAFRGYVIKEVLGSGGMSRVFHGENSDLGKHVAVKFLDRRLAEDETYIRRFRDEALALAAVNSDNVVKAWDYGDEDGDYGIVMEFIDGRNLLQLLEEVQKDTGNQIGLPAEIVLALLVDVSYGLRAAHGRNLLHRDIKPSNILLTVEGVAKIVDFGLARESDLMNRLAARDLTKAGVIIGTASYMSPEQAEGRSGNEIDQRSDIFSLGVTAYFLLTGQKPFCGSSDTEIQRAIIHQAPTPMTIERCPAMTPEIMVLLERMLHKAREKRWSDMDEVLNALMNATKSIDPTGDLAHRRREYLQRFAADPGAVAKELRHRRAGQYLNRGLGLFRQGYDSYVDAEDQLRRALLLEPNNSDAASALEAIDRQRDPENLENTAPIIVAEKGSKFLRRRPGLRAVLLTFALVVLAVAWNLFKSEPAMPVPSSLVAMPETERMMLAWQNNGNSRLSTRIYRGTQPDELAVIAEVGPHVASHVDSGLTPGVTYYYRIHSCDAKEQSALFAATHATTVAPTPILPPDSANVRAYDAAGDSPAAGITAVANRGSDATPGAAPLAPVDLHAEAVSPEEIGLTWRNDDESVTGFQIYRSTSPGSVGRLVRTVNGHTLKYGDRALSAGKTYYYSVYASRQGDRSPEAARSSATTLAGAPPPAPVEAKGTIAIAVYPADVMYTVRVNDVQHDGLLGSARIVVPADSPLEIRLSVPECYGEMNIGTHEVPAGDVVELPAVGVDPAILTIRALCRFSGELDGRRLPSAWVNVMENIRVLPGEHVLELSGENAEIASVKDYGSRQELRIIEGDMHRKRFALSARAGDVQILVVEAR